MTEKSIVKVTPEAMRSMLAHFREELPREGCGFLAGSDGTAHRYYRIHNLNPDRRRFLMDPLHVRRTELSILRRGQRIMGICHSHPEGDCFPSRWDIEGAFFDPELRLPLWMEEVQVIALMQPAREPVVKGFRIHAGGVVEEVPLVVSDRKFGVFSTST